MAKLTPGVEAAISFNMGVAPSLPPTLYSEFISSCLTGTGKITPDQQSARKLVEQLMDARAYPQLVQYLERGLDPGQARAMIDLQAHEYERKRASIQLMRSAAVACGVALTDAGLDSNGELFRNLVIELKKLVEILRDDEFLRDENPIKFTCSALLRAGETAEADLLLKNVSISTASFGQILFYVRKGMEEATARLDRGALDRLEIFARNLMLRNLQSNHIKM